MFSRRKPKCGGDVEYVETMFAYLYDAYGKPDFKTKVNPLLKHYTDKEFLKILNQISNELGYTIANIDLDYKENFLEEEFPSSFLWEENNKKLDLYITPFGQQNKDIALFEITLFLFDIKIIRDGLITFEEELYQDLNGFYKPFLVCSAIFFGFGDILLSRYFVTGYYVTELNEKREVKYYVPLDLYTMIYAYSIIYAVQFCSLGDFTFKTPINFKNEIRKEIEVCLKYIQNGNSFNYQRWKDN